MSSALGATRGPEVASRRWRLRRPASIVPVRALDSWIETFGSATNDMSSFAASPRERPSPPQWYGSPIWWTTLSPRRSGRIRCVTRTRHSISARAVVIVAQPPLSMPFCRASSGEISQNISGISSESQESHRDMPPAVWCSVSR
jgi:hypothetical protein